MSSMHAARRSILLCSLLACSDSPTTVPRALERDIIFQQELSGNIDVYAVNADGTGLVRLTKDPAEDQFPAVSPDGATIVFASSRDATTFVNELYLMNADGSNVRRLTYDSSTVAFPEFSPDGSRLAYQLLYPDDRFELVTIRADGSDRRNLSQHVADDHYAGWSPDGSRIAFSSSREAVPPFFDYQLDVFTISASGTGLVRLTETPQSEYAPSYSPDGTRIAFHSNYGAQQDIFTVDADGSGLAQLTTGSWFDGYAQWSPDGSQIVYETRPNAICCRIMTMEADGSNQRMVLQVQSAPYPRWVPRE